MGSRNIAHRGSLHAWLAATYPAAHAAMGKLSDLLWQGRPPAPPDLGGMTRFCLAAVTLMFRISLAGANLWAALLTLAASSLAFIGMGLAAAVLPLISPEKGSPATHIFQALVLLVSGVYYDVSVLPAWVRPFSHVSPATYTLRAARAALLEGAGLRALAPDLVMLLVLGVVLIPFGFAVFSAGERYAIAACCPRVL
mgnify:CR=1 FL=1